jgi:hypothetical protein
VWVQRQLTVERDAGSAVNEVLAFAGSAESERFDPREAVEREAVVQQRDVDENWR